MKVLDQTTNTEITAVQAGHGGILMQSGMPKFEAGDWILNGNQVITDEEFKARYQKLSQKEFWAQHGWNT